jgi:acetyl-CoA acyltransferase 1
VAIPKLLKQVGIDKSEIDLVELNEAFASQAVMSIESIGLDYQKVNLNGCVSFLKASSSTQRSHSGAIALGHPLGATGARQIATALPIAKRTGAKLIVSSMCIGTRRLPSLPAYLIPLQVAEWGWLRFSSTSNDRSIAGL